MPAAGFSVRAWGRESLLETIGAVQREADAAEARKLVMVTDWADLHRADATEDRDVGRAPPDPNTVAYLWISPMGRHYLVDATHPLA